MHASLIHACMHASLPAMLALRRKYSSSVLEGAPKPTGPEALQMHRRHLDPIVSARFSGSPRVSGLFSVPYSLTRTKRLGQHSHTHQEVGPTGEYVVGLFQSLQPCCLCRRLARVVFTVTIHVVAPACMQRLAGVSSPLMSHKCSASLLPPSLTFPVSDCRDRQERAENVVIEKFIDYSAM